MTMRKKYKQSQYFDIQHAKYAHVISYTFPEVNLQNPEHVHFPSLLSLEVKVTNWKVSGGIQFTSGKYHP